MMEEIRIVQLKSVQNNMMHKLLKILGEILIIFIVILCFGCSFGEKKNNFKFSKEQIEQLELGNVKPLQIQKDNSIKLDFKSFGVTKQISVKELIDDVKYIPLETTDKSLISEVNKILCTDNRFFIFDSDKGKNVYIFTNKGKFIKKIPRGQGPGEIYNPSDIAVDLDNKFLIIYDRKGLSYYDYKGEFKKRELVPFNFKNFRIIHNGFLFVMVPNRNNHLKGLSQMQILITDKKFRIISAGFPFHYSEKNNYNITDYTSSLGNNVDFSFKFTDKIYQYIDSVKVE